MIIQIKRGTTVQAAAHIGREGSFFMDLDAKRLYIHDGATAGGKDVTGLTPAEITQLVTQLLTQLEVVKLVDGLVPVEQTPVAAIATALGFTEVGGKWILPKESVSA